MSLLDSLFNEKSNPVEKMMAEHLEFSRRSSDLFHSMINGGKPALDGASEAPDDFWKKMATVTDEQLRGALEKLGYDSATIKGLDRNAMVDAVLKAYNKSSGKKKSKNPFVIVGNDRDGVDSEIIDRLRDYDFKSDKANLLAKCQETLEKIKDDGEKLKDTAKNLKIKNAGKLSNDELFDAIANKFKKLADTGSLAFEDNEALGSVESGIKSLLRELYNDKKKLNATAKQLDMDPDEIKRLSHDELFETVKNEMLDKFESGEYQMESKEA